MIEKPVNADIECRKFAILEDYLVFHQNEQVYAQRIKSNVIYCINQ